MNEVRIERVVKKFGVSGAHIYMPKSMIGTKVGIMVPEEKLKNVGKEALQKERKPNNKAVATGGPEYV